MGKSSRIPGWNFSILSRHFGNTLASSKSRISRLPETAPPITAIHFALRLNFLQSAALNLSVWYAFQLGIAAALLPSALMGITDSPASRYRAPASYAELLFVTVSAGCSCFNLAPPLQ